MVERSDGGEPSSVDGDPEVSDMPDLPDVAERPDAPAPHQSEADQSEAVPERATGPVGSSRTHRFVLWHEWPIGVVLLALAVSLFVVVAIDFRIGAVSLACGVLLAAGLRAALPVRRAGLLVLRSRWVDVVTLAVLGGGTLALAILVPEIR